MHRWSSEKYLSKMKVSWIFLLSMPLLAAGGLVFRHTECATGNLDPCTLQNPSGSVFCENINDMRTFLNVVRCGRKENVQAMYIEKSTLEYLPLFVLDYSGFLSLHVKSVVLSKLLEGNVLVRLQHLHLDRVIVLNPWSWEPLSVLRRLVHFSVSNMSIPVLNGSLVDNLNDRIQRLELQSTGTFFLNDTALDKFSELEHVSIENNEISELKRSMFPVPAKIKYFSFSYNKLSSLPNDLFDDMPHLRQIALQGNLLSLIHDHTFRGVWHNLAKLLLEGNPLKCHCKMLWLAKKNGPDEFTGSCYAPKHKYGKELKSLTMYDFQCSSV